jgi:hypothetical protein
MLQGKAKEEFEKWILNNPQGHDSQRMIKIYNQKDLFISYVGIGKTLLNALIIEWFDSVGWYINFKSKFGQRKQKEVFMFYIKNYKSDFLYTSRAEVQREAIIKTNELINKSFEKKQ